MEFLFLKRRKSGQTLIELLLAFALAALLLPALFSAVMASREGQAQLRQRQKASALLSETLQAARSVRDSGWDFLPSSGTYYPAVSGSVWTLAPGSENISGFTRSLDISEGFRDLAGNLSATGSPDPSVRKITASISWTLPRPSSLSQTFYLTRFRDNLTYVQTSVADFNSGVKTNVTVTNTSGGEVTLGAGGQSNWCDPNLSLSALDLPKNGVANALTAIEGQAFAGTGDNASGVSFADVSITDTSSPTAAVAGTFDGFKTNGIFGEKNYVYLATDNNTHEVEIVDISSLPYKEAGYFDVPGSSNASSVFVAGSLGFTTSGNSLFLFDLTSKTGSRPQVGSLALSGTATQVYVVGTYAFVSTSDTSRQLDIIDISIPSNPTLVGYSSVPGQSGKAVYINSTITRAFLATSASATQAELFIIDLTSKTGSRPVIGSYDTAGMNPKNLTIVPGNKLIIVGTGGEEYQVVDITNQSSPYHCGGLNIDTGVNGVAAVTEADGDAFSYIITGDATAEFKIIAGGPGGNYANTGIYESAIFDTGYSTAFNYFSATAVLPNPTQTFLNFQFAIADPVSGSCQSANYVFTGPDGTSGSYYDLSGPIHLDNDGIGYENPGRCFKYRAYLKSTDPSFAPVFNDITVNYSP